MVFAAIGDALKRNLLYLLILFELVVVVVVAALLLSLPTFVVVLLAGGYWYVHGRKVYERLFAGESTPLHDVSVVVVGGGFSGLGMAAKLKEAGVADFTVLEAAQDIGGTWLANRYPGARCDVHTVLYTFTYFMKPDWSCTRAPADEIHGYLKSFVDAKGLWPHIKLNTKVDSAVWHDDEQKWVITTTAGTTMRAGHLVSCCGALRHAIYPNIKGRETFKGAAFHSAAWDTGYDVANKRVAIIGSGASAVQIAPEIADKVQALHIFQRTPNWFLMQDNPDVPGWVQAAYRYVPGLQPVMRVLTFIAFEVYALVWLRTGKLSDTVLQDVKKDMTKIVADRPDLLSKVIPDYSLGCKRLLLSGDFLKTLKKPKVHLETDGIDRITEKGVVVVQDGKEREVEVDLIVYATGFDIEQSLCGFKTVGRDGHVLKEYFESHPAAYNGITVPKFPNFYMCFGPNTVLAHSSVIFMIECQVLYIVDCIRQMARYGVASIEPKPAVTDAWREDMAAMTKTRNFSGNCRAWYKNKDGINFILWPSNLIHYWWITRKVELLRDYNLTFAKSAACP